MLEPLVADAAGDADAEPHAGSAEPPPDDDAADAEAPPQPALFSKRSPIGTHPGEQRTVTILADPARVPPGSVIEIECDTGLRLSLRMPEVPEPGARGLCAIAGSQAEFDPETGVVTVYAGRREFRELERAGRRGGYTKKRVAEDVPFRMLEVEAAANAVYMWAALQILGRRHPEERPADPAEYAAAAHHEAQAPRHRAHHKRMQAFLESEIFDGAVTLARTKPSAEDVSSSLAMSSPDC